jgi:hypothetical protein
VRRASVTRFGLDAEVASGPRSVGLGEVDGIEGQEGPADMAARWLIIGSAIAAAATASYMLMSPNQRDVGPRGTPQAESDSIGAPQDRIDAESRDAMRDFLRQSVTDDARREEAGEKPGDPDR